MEDRQGEQKEKTQRSIQSHLFFIYCIPGTMLDLGFPNGTSYNQMGQETRQEDDETSTKGAAGGTEWSRERESPQKEESTEPSELLDTEEKGWGDGEDIVQVCGLGKWVMGERMQKKKQVSTIRS